MLVMLKKTWPGNFARTIRDAKGKAVDRLEFTPGEPVDLDADQLEAVAADLKAGTLVPCYYDDSGKLRTDAPPAEPLPPRPKRGGRKRSQ